MHPQGPVAAAERLILLNATGIMLVVVIPVIVLTLGFAWWYRSSNTRAIRRPQWSYSGQIELVVWAIPAMIVILLAGVAWISAHQLDPARKLAAQASPLRIEVVSLDWKWLFIYPDQHVAAVNQIVVPADTPIEFSLTSATVMNAFFVPELGSMIYTMPGMTTHLSLLAEHAGDYPGLSSHFSGNGFSDMRFTVHAVSAAKFTEWVEHTRADVALDQGAYARLAQASSNIAPAAYGDVAADLFEHILQISASRATPKEN